MTEPAAAHRRPRSVRTRDIGHVKRKPVREAFSRFARRIAGAAGSPWAFVCALLVILAWGLTGPIFAFSNTWQLFVNSFTTIVTFLMVFLIQNTQNKDTTVIQVKLNELIAAQPGASNHLIDLEDMSDADLERLRLAFQELAERAEEKDVHGRMTVEQVARAIQTERRRRD